MLKNKVWAQDWRKLRHRVTLERGFLGVDGVLAEQSVVDEQCPNPFGGLDESGSAGTSHTDAGSASAEGEVLNQVQDDSESAQDDSDNEGVGPATSAGKDGSDGEGLAPMALGGIHTLAFRGLDDGVFASQTVFDGDVGTNIDGPAIPTGANAFVGWFDLAKVVAKATAAELAGTAGECQGLKFGQLAGVTWATLPLECQPQGSDRFDFTKPIEENHTLLPIYTNGFLVQVINEFNQVVEAYSVPANTKLNGGTPIVPSYSPPAGKAFVVGQYHIMTQVGANMVETAVFDWSANISSNLFIRADSATAWTVYFQTNGSQVVPEVVFDNQTATTPANPTRTGYTFSKWVDGTDPDLDESSRPDWSFSTPIKADKLLYAVWTPIEVGYTIVYWNEKPNIAPQQPGNVPTDPGTNLDNYEIVYQTVAKSSTNGACGTGGDCQLSGTTLNPTQIGALADKYYNDAQSAFYDLTFSGDALGNHNYSWADAPAISGLGGTKINIFYKRHIYTFTVDMHLRYDQIGVISGPPNANHTEATHTWTQCSNNVPVQCSDLWLTAPDGNIYQKIGDASENNRYTFQLKQGQESGGIMPPNITSFGTAAGSDGLRYPGFFFYSNHGEVTNLCSAESPSGYSPVFKDGCVGEFPANLGGITLVPRVWHQKFYPIYATPYLNANAHDLNEIATNGITVPLLNDLPTETMDGATFRPFVSWTNPRTGVNGIYKFDKSLLYEGYSDSVPVWYPRLQVDGLPNGFYFGTTGNGVKLADTLTYSDGTLLNWAACTDGNWIGTKYYNYINNTTGIKDYYTGGHVPSTCGDIRILYNYYFGNRVGTFNVVLNSLPHGKVDGQDVKTTPVLYLDWVDDSYSPEPVLNDENHKFIGWYEDPNFLIPYAASGFDMPAKNLNLFAKYESTEVIATFDDKENGTAIQTRGADYGGNIEVYQPYEVGKGYPDLGVFKGWYTRLGPNIVPFGFEQELYSDITVFGEWDTDGFKIDYDLDGNDDGVVTTPTDTNSYSVDGNVLALVQAPVGGSPTKAGKVFAGWQFDGKIYQAGQHFKVYAPTTLKARYINPGDLRLLIFNANGGTGAQQIWYQETGDVVRLPGEVDLGFAREGYKLVGWTQTNSGNTTDPGWAIGDPQTITQNTELWAVWEPRQVLITYHLNDGSSNDQYTDGATEVENYGNPIADSPTIPVRKGYVFGGWYKSTTTTAGTDWVFGDCTATCTPTTLTMANGTVKDNLTNNQSLQLYAKWTPKSYTLRTNANYNSAATVLNIPDPKHIDDSITLPNQEREGYKFLGYSTDPTAKTPDYITLNFKLSASAISVLYDNDTLSDVTLYAVYSLYNLSYNNNGRGASPASRIGMNYGDAVSTPELSAPGWIFEGWFYDNDSFAKPVVDVWTDLDSNLSGSLSVSAHQVIHAKWLPKTDTDDWEDWPGSALCPQEDIKASMRYWAFGRNAGIQFDEDGQNPTPFPNSIWAPEGVSVVTNADGILQFYTDANTAYNRNHTVMVNGSGLWGHPSGTQTVVDFPMPGDPSKYFVVTADTSTNFQNGTLRYNIVDMSLDDGLGEVTSTKNIQLGDAKTAGEGLVAARSADGKSFWVIADDPEHYKFRAYKFTQDGPVDPITLAYNVNAPVVSTTTVGWRTGAGGIRLSPDGKRLVTAQTEPYANSAVMRFNAQTGELYEEFTIHVPGTMGAELSSYLYSVEFSPSGRYIYYGTLGHANQNSYRFDLWAADGFSTAAEKKAAVEATAMDLGYVAYALQLGPDGKIYQAVDGANYMRVISNPEAPDLAGMGITTIPIAGTSSGGLPQFVAGCPKVVDVKKTSSVPEDAPVKPGDVITYKITFTNQSDNPAVLAHLNYIDYLSDVADDADIDFANLRCTSTHGGSTSYTPVDCNKVVSPYTDDASPPPGAYFNYSAITSTAERDALEAAETTAKGSDVDLDSATEPFLHMKGVLNPSEVVELEYSVTVKQWNLGNKVIGNLMGTTGREIPVKCTPGEPMCTMNMMNAYTIKYDDNGHGTAPNDYTDVSFGTTVDYPALTEDGWKFDGWYFDNGIWSNPANDIVGNTVWDDPIAGLDKDQDAEVTLYAKWTKNKYTIDYTDTDDATDCPSIANKEWGDELGELCTPTKPGYVFDDWYYTDDDGKTGDKVDPTDTIDSPKFNPDDNSELPIYPKWTAYTYKIKFDANAFVASSGAVDTAAATNNTEISPLIWGDKYKSTAFAPATRPGYRFDGWYYEEATTTVATSDHTVSATRFNPLAGSEITLYAKWTPYKYKVEYDEQGHSEPKHDDYPGVVWDDPVNLDPLDDVPGYHFEDWAYDPDCTDIVSDIWDQSETPVDPDKNDGLTLYACWTEFEYTVTYDNNGHGGTPTPIVDQPWGSTISEPTLSEPGYVFEGWYYDDPTWTPGDLDWGGTTWDEPFKDGGWNDANSPLDGTKNTDVILHAKWTPIKYTLTYDNGTYGTLSNCTPSPNTDAEHIDNTGTGSTWYYYNIETPTFTPDCAIRTESDVHHSFAGFTGDYFGQFINPQNGETIPQISQGSTGNKVVVAEWYPFEYEVHYSNPGSGTFLHPADDVDSNFGGTPTPHLKLVWEGVTDVPDSYPEYEHTYLKPPAGYQFDGWWTKNGCNANDERDCDNDWGVLAPEIVNDDTVFPVDRSAKITFYARWIQINYTLVWVPDQWERSQLHNLDGVYCLADTSSVAGPTTSASYTFPASTAGATTAPAEWIPNSYTGCANPVFDYDGYPEALPQLMTVSGNNSTLMYTFEGLHWNDFLPDLTLLFDTPQRDVPAAIEYHHEGVYFSPEFSESDRVPGHQNGVIPLITVSDLTRFDPTSSAQNPLGALDVTPRAVSLSSLAMDDTFPAFIAGPAHGYAFAGATAAEGIGPATSAGKDVVATADVTPHAGVTPLASAALTPQARALADALRADVVLFGKTTPQTIPCANGAVDPPKCTPKGPDATATPAIANTGVEVLHLLWILLGVLVGIRFFNRAL
ncbi:hypothetical protein FACS1894125_3350 [Actinomycetota bacterium]|nr:hypothetical protein FACS1894125_3350 [Actinomycetota bacterium]